MRYRPHDSFVAPARARSEPWRVVVGYFLASGMQIGLIYAIFALAALTVGETAAYSAFRDIFLNTVTSRDTLLMLSSYGFLILGAAVVTTQLHKRPALSLVGPPGPATRNFMVTVRALVLLYLVLWVALPDDAELARNLPVDRWLLLLPLSLAALLIQTGAEEILFRGYLQQQIAARFRSPLVWMGLPALIFAWGHFSIDQAGINAPYAALWAGLFSMAAADLTARTGNLGAAVGLHFVNNAAAILIVSLPGPVSGLALYTYPFGADSPMLQPLFLVDLAMLGVSWLAARVALRV